MQTGLATSLTRRVRVYMAENVLGFWVLGFRFVELNVQDGGCAEVGWSFSGI